MSFVTEVLEEKPTVLILSEKNHPILEPLKEHLKRYKAEVFYSPYLPKNLRKFEYIFLINEQKLPDKKLFTRSQKVTFIYFNNEAKIKWNSHLKSNQNLKIINITGDKTTDVHIDKILWFTFSQGKEKFLQLTAAKKASTKKIPWQFSKLKRPTNKKIILFLVSCFLLLHILFFPFLFAADYFLYQSALNLKNGEFIQSEKYFDIASAIFSLAKGTYRIPRTTFLIFSLTFPDFLFKNTERAYLVIDKSLNLRENSSEILKLILKKDKSLQEKQNLILRLNTIKENVSVIEDNLNDLSREIPLYLPDAKNIKADLTNFVDLISRLKGILPYADSLFAKNTEKVYLLLFANNMELRPGGGFIGSFALLNIKDYTVTRIKVYDVYDADGQLAAHVEPPPALRQYLDQPNWFLRDSAFSPDLVENYAQAKFFLEKEMKFTNFSGAFLITTTAVQNILAAFPEIYLADFNEKINQKNFYLKTQYYTEKNFFPGSIQKKNFLGSLTQTILLELENASTVELAKAFKKSLDEKQIAVYFDDSKFQKVLDSFYWSGRTIESTCVESKNSCISDYLLPIDANLGLNKVNFFVTRNIKLNVSFGDKEIIKNNFSIRFKNESADVFPGGAYRNYFQLYLPKGSIIKKIEKDGISLENYSEETGQYQKIGFLLEIPPKSFSDINISYELPLSLKKGRNIYQLIVQKQIGASNSDLQLSFDLGKNIHLLNQNFPALVKEDQIVYNTSLSADKIFFVEVIKE